MLQPNLCENTDGFSVEVLGQTGLRYEESGRFILIDSEVTLGSSGMMIYRDSIESWESPNGRQAVVPADRERVIQNIRAAFRYQGFDIDVI